MTLQSSPGWVRERIGCVSASRMKDVLDFRKDGKPGAKRLQYMAELVTERAFDKAVDHPITVPMRRGLAEESNARAAYEDRTGFIVAPARWVPHPRIPFAGSTPDGFIGREGLVEFKVPMSTTYTTWRMAGEIPAEHIPQLLFQCATTGRKWVDFCAYCPEATDPRLRLFIRRFEPTAEQIADIEQKAIEFLAEVDEAFEQFTETA